MEIFSNWFFWIVLSVIVFVFAMIGFLAESRKKKEKAEKPKDVDKAINSTLTAKVEPGATLNLDNGTWKNESNVQNVSLSSDSFSMPEVNSAGAVSEINSDTSNVVSTSDSVVSNDISSSTENLEIPTEPEVTDASDLFNNNDDDDVWNV